MRGKVPATWKGFTLVELLVVTVLLGFVLTLGLPAFSGSIETLKAREASRHVVRLLQLARAGAIALGRPVNVVVDFERQRIVPSIGVTYQPPRGMRLKGDGSDRLLLEFYPDGSASRGGFSLTTPGQDYHYAVNPMTGRVNRERSSSPPL